MFEIGADDRADGDALGEDELAGAVQRLVGRALTPQLEEGRAAQQVVARLGIGKHTEASRRVEPIVAVVVDILQRHAGDQVAMFAESVVNPGIVERYFRRHRLLLVQFIGQADAALDREVVVGVRVLEHRLDVGEELRRRPDHAGLLEHDAGIVVELADAVGADAADGAVYAQFLGVAEQVAVAPVPLEPEPVDGGIGTADTEETGLALTHPDIDRDVAVGVELVGLLEGDAVEHFERQQPVARVADLLGRVLPAPFQPGHVFGEVAIHLVGALDGGGAVAGHRAGRDRQRHIERRGGVVGDDLAIRDLGQWPALFLQGPHDQRLGPEHGA